MIKTIQPLGDMGIRLSFGEIISKELNAQIRRFHMYIKQEAIKGVIESVPAYTSLTIYYDPFVVNYETLVMKLEEIEQHIDDMELPSAELIEIPVLYGGEFGPDLHDVAEHNMLTKEQVIERHQTPVYRIYMLGFMPGFPYLGGMDERIATPRLDNPRLHIQPGSVGIAGFQTGIYPLASPGGWRIIGRTPVKLYDPTANNPILLSMGDSIKFVSITKEQYKKLAACSSK
ncbi:5-oxoprolinase subunit PxpB [Bacillus solimangrovi]|uniref:5-oxoprolinase subunit PxpB n=1 Tax=Bacillus solimangrovi TaxID=1305675 RepID=UPI001FDFF19F|nr:5-oxoprolinase subunit PxpB [Bacillus solimangrovi]